MAQETTRNTEADRAAHPAGERAAPRTSGEQFRLMVEQIKDYAIFLMDPDGIVRSWNAGAERLKGYRPEEIVGRHFSIFYSAEDVRSGLPEKELETARAAGSLEREGWRLRKDGSRFWASVTITALYDDAGELTGFGKVTRDVTERRNAEEALKKSRTLYESLFENAPDAVVVVDNRGLIRKVNQQAELLFGYLREEMVGWRVERLMPERFQKAHLRHLRSYFKDPRVRRMGTGLALYGISRDGREFPLDIMLTPMETGEGAWSFAVIRDVTLQKQNEARIRELNSSLQSQVEQLIASNREQEAFSYTISHDLRAPLRHILGFVELLETRDLSALDQKSRHYLQVITGAGRKMGELIDDLLSFSRIGRVEMSQCEVDLHALVRGVVAAVAETARDRDIEWEIGPLPTVLADPEMLRQVMVNLIGNAVKFTRPRARARIEVGTQDLEGETLVYVRDNGVGFDFRYVHKLFGVFQRLHTSDEFEGTGVGLANVQRIIERHGGRVWAEGAVDAGATIWFSLPKK